jgi:hypothetical protein
MSTQLTERRIREWLSYLIPVPTDSVPEDERTCAVWQEPYPASGEGGDYPVRVDSTWPDSNRRHVFGRRCTEDYLSSNRGYSTRCPVCRERWFARPAELSAHWIDATGEQVRQDEREAQDVIHNISDIKEQLSFEMRRESMCQRMEADIRRNGTPPPASPAPTNGRPEIEYHQDCGPRALFNGSSVANIHTVPTHTTAVPTVVGSALQETPPIGFFWRDRAEAIRRHLEAERLDALHQRALVAERAQAEQEHETREATICNVLSFPPAPAPLALLNGPSGSRTDDNHHIPEVLPDHMSAVQEEYIRRRIAEAVQEINNVKADIRREVEVHLLARATERLNIDADDRSAAPSQHASSNRVRQAARASQCRTSRSSG